MHFVFALDLSDIDLWNIDFLDTHLYLLDTYIPSKHVSKASLRHVFKKSSRYIFKSLEDLFSVTIFRLPRRLEDVLKKSWKTKNCYTEDVLKTTSRHVFRTSSRCLEDQQMFAGMCEFCSWLTLKIWEQRHSGVFIANFEQISHSLLVFPSLTVNK